MSNEILTVKITVLEDGQIEAVTNKNNEVVYLQPVIVVDTKEANQRIEVKGSRGSQIRVSEDISEIDGVAFSGDFEALETALREAALKANGLLNGGVSGGGGGGNVTVTNNTDPATATKQDKVIQLLTDILSSKETLQEQISLSYAGNLIKNLTSDADIDGKTIPSGSRGNIVSIQDLGAGNVNYRFDSGTPSDTYGTISGNRPFDKLTNVNFDTFRIKAQAGGADYTIIINLYN